MYNNKLTVQTKLKSNICWTWNRIHKSFFSNSSVPHNWRYWLVPLLTQTHTFFFAVWLLIFVFSCVFTHNICIYRIFNQQSIQLFGISCSFIYFISFFFFFFLLVFVFWISLIRIFNLPHSNSNACELLYSWVHTAPIAHSENEKWLNVKLPEIYQIAKSIE